MAKKHKKLLFITVILSLLFISSTYAALIPNVHAAEMTPQQKGLSILSNVMDLDMTKYTTTIKECAQDSYMDVIPQESVRFYLESNRSKVDIRYTFVNGKLRKIHVLESEGSPSLTKTAANTLETAKSFLSSYQGYSGDSFYSELGSMLNDVDTSKNLTKTTGNTKLEVTNSEDYEIFKWIYIFNNVEAPDKCVALGYKNGFLKYFIDNWNLYKIGSTSVNLSKEEAIEKGMESAKAFSWKMGSGNNTYRVKDFNVANAMVWETVFLSNLYADTPRGQDPLMLYPMRHVWVSLDKFYPGNVYGINVYVWADTGEVAYIHERVSTLDPPADLAASIDDFTVETVKDQMSEDATQFDVISIPWLVLPAFAVIMLGTVPVWLARKKNLSKRGFFKICGMLLCVLISSTILLGQVSTVNAASQKECIEIWGSESTGANETSSPSGSWRKSADEIDCQDQVSYLISTYFSNYYHGYHADDNQGDDSLKSMILDDISYAEANYPRVAVVDFDHGMGRDDYQGLCEFHFMFEDNIGTAIGDRDHTIWVPDNGVYDMDIYPRTALGKVNFAFINTCYSANLTNPETGQPWQGVVAGTYRARGMPFAWARSQVGYGGISSYGYSDPDGGDFCYIGFPFGSAALNQTIGGSGPQYWLWVRDFFWFASSPDNSINNALDDASFEHYDEPFSNTNLFQNFSAFWPLWNETSQEWEGGAIPNCHMVVYGNGNLHLYRKGGIWHLDGNALDSSHNNDGAIYGATWTTGKFGSALSFDGNDRVQIADSESLNIKNALTISYWVKRTADSGGYHVLKKDAFGGLKDLGSNLFNFWTYHVGGQDGWQISTDTITLNQFHLVTLTWTPGHKKAYVDGSLIAEKTDSRTDDLRQDASEPVFIGNSQGWHAYNFAGIIDEVRIYDYVLSAGQIADNAAVASCHFNGGNSAYDSAPYVNTGTVYGASWATGLRTSSGFSYGLSFDGSDDYVNIPDSDSLDLSSAVTVEAWIKPSRLDVWQSPLEKGAPDDWAYGFYIEPAGGNIGFEIGKEGSPVTWAGAVAPVNSYLEVGKMSHIVGTADSATGKVYLYIDGYKRGEGNFSGQINTNSIPFQVGKRYEGGYFGGVIDEVRIYDRALSASEIYSYYLANKPVHWLIVDGFSVDGIGTDIWIDGQYAGYNTAVSSVSQGTHTVEVNDWFVHPYYGYFVFDHFAYDSTTDYNNPMTLTVSKDTAVFADYYYYGW